MQCTTPAGYGRYWVPELQKQVYAHRYSWELANKRKVPPGKRVLHSRSCISQRDCVNPAHLYLGTDLDNAQDKIAQGRQPKGERQWHHRLTKVQVIEIRSRYKAGARQAALAREYGVSHVCLHNVVRYKTWKEVL